MSQQQPTAYKAKFTFKRRDNEELDLMKGDVVTFVSSEDSSWWRVQNKAGQSGLVPQDYLEQIPSPEQTPSRHELRGSKPAAVSVMSVVCRAVAKFAYRASRDDELDMQKGDLVEVLEKEGDGWWRGRTGGREGWFPANYVDDKEASPSPPPPSSRNSAPVICKVVAMFGFSSGNPEELQFAKGEIMEVTDQPPEDPDWWEARKQGSATTGLIPKNYVEIVEEGAESFSSSSSPSQSSAAQVNGSEERYPFCSEVWYHGKMSRGHAENSLKENARNGQFLVRASETKPGDFSVSVKAPDCIKHFRVQIGADTKYTIGSRKFDSMYCLIEHYRKAPIYTPPGGKVFLTDGVKQ